MIDMPVRAYRHQCVHCYSRYFHTELWQTTQHCTSCQLDSVRNRSLWIENGSTVLELTSCLPHMSYSISERNKISSPQWTSNTDEHRIERFKYLINQQ